MRDLAPSLVEIYVLEELSGPGFFLSSRFVVTAAHSVEGISVGDPIDLRELSGSKLSATLVHVDSRDFAVIAADIPDSETVSRALPPAPPVEERAWRSPYRHPVHQAIIKGKVASLVPDFTSQRGGVGRGVQLDVDQHNLPGYEGYSGSPVQERNRLDAVIAVLIEHRKLNPLVATNILFGVDIRDVVEAYEGFSEVEYFDNEHAMNSQVRLSDIKDSLLDSAAREAELGLWQANLSTFVELAFRDFLEGRGNDGEF